MPWITLDCGILDHPKFVALPSDAARLGWIATMLEAKQQRLPGRFADERHYRHVIGKYARFLPNYLAEGLLELDGEALVVHDWSEHQRDKTDPTAAERQRRWRERHGTRDVTDTVTRDVTPSPAGGRAVAVPVAVDVVTNEESGTLRALEGLAVPVKGMDGQVSQVEVGADPVPAAVRQLQKLAADLTGAAFVSPFGGLMEKAVAEQLPHGFTRVEQAWRRVAAQVTASGTSKPNLRQLVLGADDILNPVPRADVSVQREDEARAAFDKRVARTKAEIRRLHGEPEPA